MITINDISILITSTAKDVQRLQSVYKHIRLQYPDNEIVIVYDGVDKKQIHENDPGLIQIPSQEKVYVSGGYNLALKKSTKPAFVFLHDDTYPAPQFLESLIEHITENNFCNFCQVEPPVFGDADSITKPIRNFGLRNTPFKKEEFESFYWDHVSKLPYKFQPSPYGGFFMAGLKESILSVGGFDENFQPYFFEDSDLMIRLHMAGYTFTLALNSLVYHVGSLTSREFNNGIDAQKITQNIFLKKWKTTFEYYKKYSIDNAIPYKKSSVKIEHKNCNLQLGELLDLLSEETANIVVNLDGLTIKQEDIDYLLQLPYIIHSELEKGLYTIGNLQIKI
jgi:GT2 family glycosyltransferase